MINSDFYFSKYKRFVFSSLKHRNPDYIHYFCFITELYLNYAEVKSVCPMDKRIYRWLFVKKSLYDSEGVLVGNVISFHLRRTLLIFFKDSNAIVEPLTRLYVFDPSYKRVFDDFGDDIHYDFNVGMTLSILEKDERYLDYYSKNH